MGESRITRDIPQQLLERIRVFLTDQYQSKRKVAHMSNQVMLTVEAFYKQPEDADGYRNEYGLTDIHNMGLDSGGFQFLMGKLEMPNQSTLPCGITVPSDAQQTIDLYKRTGLTEKDLPIQLDLPPRYDIPSEHRKQLLEQGAKYYYEMLSEIPNTIPVIHGWTLEEIEYSLELCSDPDVLGVGTNKGLLSVDYTEYAVSRGTPKMATPIPGKLDIREGTPLVNTVVATGTNMSNVTGPLGEKVKKGVTNQKKKRVSYNVILDRLVMISQRLCEEYEVFFLGGASPHMIHQIFMLGGKWTDTSSWRIKGIMGEIYLPDRYVRRIGDKGKGRPVDNDDIEALKECLSDETHPFSGMSANRFLEIGRMLRPEWYETWEDNQWEVYPDILRCLHNAWMLKQEEKIANDLAGDPDKYYKYLRDRLESDNHPRLVKRLDYIAKKSGLKRAGQTNLDVFIKGRG